MTAARPDPATRRAAAPRSGAATEARTAAGAGGRLLVVAAAAAFLLLRPGGWALPGAPAVLAAGYLALAAAAARAAGPGRAGPLPWAATLAVGLAAVAAVAGLSGPTFAVRADAVALALNTLAAVAEEAAFRGVLYGLLERAGRTAPVPGAGTRPPRPAARLARAARGGPALAIGGSALLFALLHVPLYGAAAFPVDLGAGLLFGWQRWSSGSWTVPAATHAAANLLVVIPLG